MGDDLLSRHVAAWVSGYDSEHTRTAYTREANRWLAWCAANNIDPLKTDRPAVNTWRNAGPLLAPASKARRLSAVASFYDYLVNELVIPSSPFAHIKRPKRDSDYSPTRGLTRAEANALLMAAEHHSPQAHALICLLLLQGLRISEARNARHQDIHTSRGMTLLPITRKGGRRHDAPLTPRTLAAVRALGTDHGPIVGITYDGAYRLVKHLAKRANIESPRHVTPHVCRHAFVTLALDAGVPLRDVQDAAGHKDPRTTRRYDRSRDAAERHPGTALETFLAGPLDTTTRSV